MPNRFFRKYPPRQRFFPYILIVGGAFLVLVFTPLWMWVSIFGFVVIIIGLGILKRWR